MVESALRQCHNTSRMSVEYDYSLALDIVNRYYQNLVEDMAREICEREESIMDGGFGWMEIEDRYANKFFNISQIYCNLKKFCTAEGEDEEEPETSLSSPAATGIEASRLQIDERICNAYDVRESIENWLEDNPDATLWNFRVSPLENGQRTCLFFFSA